MNNPFSHILVPFDNSAASRVALRTAVNIATSFNSKMSMIYVDNGSGNAEKALEIKGVLEKIKSNTTKNIELIIEKGKMHKEVVRTAETIDADLIIMGTHGTSGFEEFWIGSNAYRVVNSSEIPVLTMQEKFDQDKFSHIVVPIDDSRDTKQKLPMIAKLAKTFRTRVHLFGTSKYSGSEVQGNVKRNVAWSKELLAKETIDAEVAFKFGANIADLTMEHAKEVGADLIVMMSESEPSMGFFMGSNAQRLVNHSEIPVLTLHPKDIKVTSVGY